jgi:hypothetical protein
MKAPGYGRGLFFLVEDERYQQVHPVAGDRVILDVDLLLFDPRSGDAA